MGKMGDDGMLSKLEIQNLIEEKGLITDYADLDTQLQANGFDLTISYLRLVTSEKTGVIDFDNSGRVFPLHKIIVPVNHKWTLYPGIAYIGLLGETVNLPEDIAALTFARSSLMRCGIQISNAVWDKGYHGRGMIGISTNAEVVLCQGARILQMCFFRVQNDGSKYEGVFQGEGL